MAGMGRFRDLSGMRFGMILVLIRVANNAYGRSRWLCRCDCGKEWEVNGQDLWIGDCVSCGCARPKRAAEMFSTHGMSRNVREYKIWIGIKTRCYNPRYAHFNRYGGRGIKMCGRWRDSFPAFLADMGRRPTPKHSVERIDNDGDYEPGNCRWATHTEQMRNTCKTKLHR